MELSTADMNYINQQEDDNPVHRYLINIIPHNFKVGDYLIKEIRDLDMAGKPTSPWRVVKISPQSNLNKKYIVVHVDKHGVPYIKHMKVNGKLGGIICMAAIDFRSSKFQLDPDHMEHIMMGEQREFDPLERYKEKKNETN